MTPRRTRLLFIALLIAQLFLLASQEPDRAGGAGSLLEGAALRGLGPVARLVRDVSGAFASASDATRTRRELLRENERLRAELLELRRAELRREGLEQENEGLARALAFARQREGELRPAEVVYADHGSWLRALVLYVGAGGARTRPSQAVVTDAGLVGRVVFVAGPYAKVQLVTDRAAAVGVQLERSRRQGVLRGSQPGELLLDFVPRQVEIEAGERVVTAGIDGVYPRGIPVGVVASVEPGDEAFHRIVVTPAVDFSRLSFVYLLEAPLPPAAMTAPEKGVTEGDATKEGDAAP